MRREEAETENKLTDEINISTEKENFQLSLREPQILEVGLFNWHKKHIRAEANKLIKKYNYDEDCVSVGEAEALSRLLQNARSKYDQNLFFLSTPNVKNSGKNETKILEWAVWVIIILENKVYILYKGIRNPQIPQDLRHILRDTFKNRSINFIANKDTITDERAFLNGGQGCLNNLRIILEQYETRGTNNFINTFEHFAFPAENQSKIVTVDFGPKDASIFVEVVSKFLELYSHKELPDNVTEHLSKCLLEKQQSNIFKESQSRDVRIRALELINILFRAGKPLDNVKEIVVRYYVENKNEYLNKIREGNAELLENVRDKDAKIALKIAVNNGLKFIVNVYNLMQPQQLHLHTLIDFISLVYEDTRAGKKAENNKQNLINEYKSAKNQTEKIKENMQKIQREIDFHIIKQEINAKDNNNYVCDLILILFETLLLLRKRGEILDYDLDDKIINWIINACKNAAGSERVVKAAINILCFLPENTEINNEDNNDDLDEIFSKLSANSDNFRLVLNLCLKIEFSKPCASLIRFLLRNVETLEDSFDVKTVRVLNKLLTKGRLLPKELEQEVREIIELENKCGEFNDGLIDCKHLLQVFKNRVERKKKLSFNCFKVISKHFTVIIINEEKIEYILREIVENNIQRLPKFFVDDMKGLYVKKCVNSELILLYISLIKNDYISINEIGCIDILISGDDRASQSRFLEIIYIAFQKGQRVSDNLIDRIEKLPASSYKINVLNRIKGIESHLEIASNPRKVLSERQMSLGNILSHNDINKHDQYVVKVLQNLIIFDRDVRVEAIHALNVILVENPEYEIDLEKILLAIRDCNFDINSINKLFDKVTTTKEFTSVLDFLIYTCELNVENKSVLLSAVSFLTDIANKIQKQQLHVFTEEHAVRLHAIIRSTTISSTKNKVIDILENAFSDEQLLKFIPHADFVPTKTLRRCLLNDAFAVSTFDEFFSKDFQMIISKGYHITLYDFIDIWKVLVQLGDYITKFEEILFVISKNQGLHRFMYTICDTIWKCICAENKQDILNLMEILQEHLINADRLNCKERGLKISILQHVANFCTEKMFSKSEKSKKLLIKMLIEHLILEKQRPILRPIAFGCLKLSLNEVKPQLLNTYYKILKNKLQQSDRSVGKTFDLVDIHFRELTQTEKYSWLSTLNTITLYNRQLNPEDFSRKELLRFAILNSAAGEYNENELKLFNNYCRLIDSKITEDTLELLLIKLSIFDADIKQINDVIHIIFEFPQQSYNFFLKYFSKADNFIGAIKRMWLALKLNSYEIKYTKQQLTQMCPYIFASDKSHKQLFIDLKSLSIKINNLKKNNNQSRKYQTNCIEDYLLVLKMLLEKERYIDSCEIALIPSLKYPLKPITYLLSHLIILDSSLTMGKSDLKTLRIKLFHILEIGWSVDSIKLIIQFFKNSPNHCRSQMLAALDIIYEFKLKEYENDITGECVLDIIFNSSAKEWSKKLHALALFQTFRGTFDKSNQQLSTELLNLNSEDDNKYLKNNKFVKDLDKVHDIYNSPSKWMENADIISSWKDAEINEWALLIKNKFSDLFNSVDFCEKIAVVKRAMELTSGFSVRDIQLISLLCLLNCEKNKGRLSQVNTGEGKTTIVAMFAAVKALDGHSIDIITSSPELAKPQCEQQAKFFSIFGFSVAHNHLEENLENDDIKEVYKKTIVYGAASDFQGDILRDEFSKLGTRSGRKFDIAIVDEVDSMLIDGKNHIVMLSSQMPGMNHLEPLLAAIWLQLNYLSTSLVEKDGKCYFVTKNPRNEEVKHHIDNKIDFIRNRIEVHLRSLLRDEEHLPENEKNISKEYPEIKIPKHLREFVTNGQLMRWIDSAIYAKYNCNVGQHYLISPCEKITPIDASNTGVVQQNTNWSDGLHQFLQLKEGVKIFPENLPTNYISNVSYFKRYGSNIYGLTGTLGSEKSREFLRHTYNVDVVVIPPFRKKQHRELAPIVTTNESEWYGAIVDSTLNKLHNDRGVLIITNYISEAQEVKRIICEEKNYDKLKVKLYTTEQDAKVVCEEIGHGQVIIATNIAGRGTDIKTSSVVEQNGGLHVLITFLPKNERVEFQNVGRTSRTGNRGTSQLILLESSRQFKVNALKIKRNEIETQSLQKLEIEDILNRDKIFSDFCKLLNDFNFPTEENENIKRAVEERFAIWLQGQTRASSSGEAFQESFRTFQIDLKNGGEKNLIKNPYFYVLRGNEFLKQEKFDQAIVEYSRAIDLDPHFADNAYYNRGYARIAKYGKLLTDCKKIKHAGLPVAASSENSRINPPVSDGVTHEEAIKQINSAIKDFKNARKKLSEKINHLYLIRSVSPSHYNNNVLSKQLQNQNFLFNTQLNAIEQAIGCDEDEIDEEIKHLKERKQSDIITSKDVKQIDVYIKFLISNKDKKGVILEMLEQNHNITIAFLAIEQTLPTDENIDLYQEELLEFTNNGFISSFQVSEMKAFPWLSVLSLAVMTIAEIVVGGVLLFTAGPFASILGSELIFQGIEDICATVNVCVNRNFEWKFYAQRKAFKLTICISICGISAISKVFASSNTWLKMLGSAVSKAEFTRFAADLESRLTTVKDLSDKISQYNLTKVVLSRISEIIVRSVEPKLSPILTSNDKVKEMIKLDLKYCNNKCQSLVQDQVIQKECSPDHSCVSILCQSISQQLISKEFSEVLESWNFIEKQQLDSFLRVFSDGVKDVINQYPLELVYRKEEELFEKFYGINDVLNEDTELLICKGSVAFTKDLSKIASTKICNILQNQLFDKCSLTVLSWGVQQIKHYLQ